MSRRFLPRLASNLLNALERWRARSAGLMMVFFVAAGAAWLGFAAPARAQSTVQFNVLHQFGAFYANGAATPEAPLIIAGNGGHFGVSYAGGVNNRGAIYVLTTQPGNDFAGPTLSTLYSFAVNDGSGPLGALAVGSDGALYGTAYLGGANNNGTVFRFTLDGDFSVIHTFSALGTGSANSDGAEPEGGLVLGADGALYGTTSEGGTNGQGTVYKITADGTLTTLYNFNATAGSSATNSDGANPVAGLMLGRDGYFYGTAYAGGTNGKGTVFRVSSTGSFRTVHSFSAPSSGVNTDGWGPRAALVQDANGFVYGTAKFGGASGYGVVFKITLPAGAKPIYEFSTLHSFASTDGADPIAPVVVDSSGNLYGTTEVGGSSTGGTVFEISSSGTFSSLHSFPAPGTGGVNSGGAYPDSGLAFDSDGSLIGVTRSGGASGKGTFYRVQHLSDGFSQYDVEIFGPANNNSANLDGVGGYNGLVQAGDGNYYGTARGGGQFGSGTLFQVTPGGTFTLLHEFGPINGNAGANTDGALPTGLTVGADGNLYGVAANGGANGAGAVFEATLDGTVTVLHNFAAFDYYLTNSDGAYPIGSLLLGSDQNLYGTAQYGGANATGTVFQFAPSTGTFTLLYTFSAVADDGNGNFVNYDGANPSGTMVEAADGSICGSSSGGGANGTGDVFQLYPTNGTEFDLIDLGTGALGGLTPGPDGTFLCALGAGSADDGSIIQTDVGEDYSVLHTLNGDDGAYPYSSPVMGNDGCFYGATQTGGTNGEGTIYQLYIGEKDIFSSLYSFSALSSGTNSDGSNPLAPLVQGSDGYYYGLTSESGPGGSGTIFQLIVSPTILSAEPPTGYIGNPYSYQIVTGNGPTGYAIEDLPPGLGFNGSGVISGTPTTAGTYTTTVNATNAAGTGTQSFNFAILPASNLAFGTSKYTVNEDAGSITVQVLRSGRTTGTTTVKCATASSTAKSGTDYTGKSQTLSWADGDTSQKAFTVTIADLGLTDGSSRAFKLLLSNPSPDAAPISPSTATVTIRENDPVAGELEFDASSYTVNEDAGTFTAHVKRTVGSTGAISVVCGTTSGTAKAGTDYTGSSKTISWAAGDSAEKTFTVSIKDLDLTDGSTRQFGLKLSSPSGGSVLGKPATATVTIKENDPPAAELELSSANYTVSQSSGTLTIAVERTDNGAGAVSVVCATKSGTAKSGTDYVGTSKTLSWAAGDSSSKTFSVTIINRGSSGGNGLTFDLQLSSPEGYAVLGSPAAATVTIE